MIDQNPDKKRPGMGFIEMWHAFLLDFCKNWQNRFHKLVKSCHQASPDKMHVRKEQKRNKVYTKSGMLQMTFKSCGHYCKNPTIGGLITLGTHIDTNEIILEKAIITN